MSLKPVRQVGNVAIYDLLGSGDTERIEKMLRLYAKLFPQYQHYVPRMRRRSSLGMNIARGISSTIGLLRWTVEPAALRTFRYVRGRRCGLAHALAVDPAFREVMVTDRRLAVYVIYECLNQVIQDAKEKGDLPVYGMVNEVEPHRLMEHYKHNGLVQLPLRYLCEPIFPPEVEGSSRSEELANTRFSPMHIGFLPNPEAKVKEYTCEMISDFVKAFLVERFPVCLKNVAVLEVLDTINRQDEII